MPRVCTVGGSVTRGGKCDQYEKLKSSLTKLGQDAMMHVKSDCMKLPT